jgi:gliding motility-associated-like protein
MVSITDNVAFHDLSSGGVVHWAWNFGDSVTSTLQNPTHVFADTGTYIVTEIVISQNGCVDSIKHVIETKDYMFYIPNAFTPNGDGSNDFFFAKGLGITEYEMWIFDRWGNNLFYCKVNGLPQSQSCQWDGTVQGGTNTIVHEDVYVWKVHFLNVFGTTYDFVGNVSVVK